MLLGVLLQQVINKDISCFGHRERNLGRTVLIGPIGPIGPCAPCERPSNHIQKKIRVSITWTLVCEPKNSITHPKVWVFVCRM